MIKQPDIEPLPAAVVTVPDLPAPLGGILAMRPLSPRKAPVLDADFDDIVPGYSDSDSWYEP